MTKPKIPQPPQLNCPLSNPMLELENHLLSHQHDIENWLRRQWQVTPSPLQCSVDLRNAGFKIAPVDTNLFPAGYNNLNPQHTPLCIQAVQSTFEQCYPDTTQVLIIPENNTRNLFYLESLATLTDIIDKAGFDVRVGTLLDSITEAMSISLPSGRQVTLEPIKKQDDKLTVNQFTPDLILLNNDLVDGIPPLLQNLSQPISPPLDIGWATRLKSHHFGHYQSIVDEFSIVADFDPWLINPLFRNCGQLDFMEREGEECVIKNATALLESIQKKYDEYNIAKRPFIVVKADAGSYGMGVMTLHDPEQIRQMNRKQRSRMAKTKGQQTVNRVIIQEGVYTFETIGDEQTVAEPVVYMLGHHVVGGFYRIHSNRGPDENLNSPGMHFEPFAFPDPCNAPSLEQPVDQDANRFYTYGVIARLALLAAARELKEVNHDH